MKKTIFVTWLGLITFFLCGLMASHAKIPGDYNNNGRLDLKDAVLGFQIIAGLIDVSEDVEGRISGKVVDETNQTPLSDVKVSVIVKGKEFVTQTNFYGIFKLDTEGIFRNEGYNVRFEKDNYQPATQAAVFELANLRTDLGQINLRKESNSEIRMIIGKVFDNFSNAPLVNAIVTTQDSNQTPQMTTTDQEGNFQLSSEFFMLNSSYVITISSGPHYVETSSVVARIDGPTNTIENESIHLYLKYGYITGTLVDDDSLDPLSGVVVNAIDDQGSTISETTNEQGQFTLTSSHFYLGKSYSVNLSKTEYLSQEIGVTISFSGENPINDGPIHLMVEAKISGKVQYTESIPIPGAVILVTHQNGDPVLEINGTTNQEITTNEEGGFDLSSPEFKKGLVYHLTLSHPQYETFQISTQPLLKGTNTLGSLTMIPKMIEGVDVTGSVVNAYDTSIKIAASLSVIDAENTIRTAQSDPSTGKFIITGNFKPGVTYKLTVSANGYTGDLNIANTDHSFTVNSNSQKLEPILLYPIGIMATINSQNKFFTHHVKQTYEKFLTEKIGFTLSARDNSDIDTASSFYIHMDDIDNPLPAIPKGYHRTTFVAVNGNKTSSTIASGIIKDPRTNIALGPRNKNSTLPPLNMLNSTMHHFLVTDAGTFVLEITGDISSYLKIVLLNNEGTQLMTQKSQLSITLNPGWYFVIVESDNETIYGQYKIGITGPEQTSNPIGTWTTNDLILSYFEPGKGIYIAGKNEAGSEGSITITHMERIGQIARGHFSGTIRAIDLSEETLSINGFFNIIRSE